MILTLLSFGMVLVSCAFCCQQREFESRDGHCCPMCPPGSSVLRDCTGESGTRCGPCESGTYMNQPNGLQHCLSCSSCIQGHGLMTQEECTATSNTVCDVVSGFFCKTVTDEGGCSFAEKHKQCLPGQSTKEKGTKRNDTVCEPCQPGSFSEHGVKCTSWTNCSETQVKVKEGSVISDIVCASASRSHVCAVLPLVFTTLAVAAILIRGKLPLRNASV